MIAFLKNPISVWLIWFAKSYYFKIQNRKNKLQIRYLANISNCKFGLRVQLYQRSTVKNAEIGDFSYVGRETKISNAKIGKFCSIGPEVLIGLGMHPSNKFVSTHPIFFSPKRQAGITFANKSFFNEHNLVEIGNDVWIGARAIILDGIVIEDGAIVAAGSVVTKNVPAYSIAGGVPARIIKFRFSEHEIKILKNDRWWEKDIQWLKENFEKFHDIKSYVDFVK